MFWGCESLSALDVSGFGTSLVSDMSYMFCDCSSLGSLDLSGFDMSAVSNASGMFGRCELLSKVTLGEDFAFVGDDGYLPSLRNWSDPIKWRNSAGRAFEAKDIPSNVADAYTAVVAEPAPEFADVSDATSHQGDILWLASSGVSSGFPDGTFRPYATVVRCDMAAFLYRLAGSPAYAAPAGAKFGDMNVNTPHYKEVCWLAEMGISTGYPDGTFRPYSTVARCGRRRSCAG